MNWNFDDSVEIFGAIAGLVFLYLEIKQNRWLWPLGLLTSGLYIYVFFTARLYADMSLQFYYVFISIYGWILWSKGDGESKGEIPIKKITAKLFFVLIIFSVVIYITIAYILVAFTDASVPYWDAFTTALSIVATWMLARKILEQWLVWIVVNAVSLGLYIYKGLYPTSILFLFYTSMAIVGYWQWRKSYLQASKTALI